MKVSVINQVIVEQTFTITTVSKNAMLRGLNVIHAIAPNINVGAQPAFHQFMEYVGILLSSNNQNIAVVCKSLRCLRQSVIEWVRVGQ